MDGITLAPRGPLHLARKVVVGAIDIVAVGARVLLSLQPSKGWTVRDVAVDVQGLQPPNASGQDGDTSANTMRPVLAAASVAEPGYEGGAASEDVADGAQRLPATSLLVRNLYAPGTAPEAVDAAPEVSLLVLNAALPEGAQAEVAAALLDLLAPRHRGAGAGAGGDGGSGGSGGGQEEERDVVLVAAMLLQHLAQPAPLYQLLLNGAAPLDPALPPLPTAAAALGSSAAAAHRLRVRDGQLAALLHVAAVSGTRAACLLAPGHKPPASTPLDLPDSAAACDALGAALAAALGLQYDPRRCRSLRALYKWFIPEKTAGNDVMYL